MPLQIPCPCGKTLKVPENLAGKKVKCPSCAEILEVPASPPPPVFDPDVIFDEIASSPRPPKPAPVAAPDPTETTNASASPVVSGGTVVALWNQGFLPSPFRSGTFTLTDERVIENSRRLIGTRHVEIPLSRIESAAIVSHGHVGLLIAGFFLLGIYGIGILFLIAYAVWRPTYLVIRGSATTLALTVKGDREPYLRFMDAVLISCSRR